MRSIFTNYGDQIKVDDDDCYWLNRYGWSLNSAGYATSSIGLMHRLIVPGTEEIHHIDSNKLNNQRSNLRSVTHSKNMLLIDKPNSNNTTGYRGVIFRYGKYIAQTKINYKYHCIGHFDTAEEAYQAYLEFKEGLLK